MVAIHGINEDITNLRIRAIIVMKRLMFPMKSMMRSLILFLLALVTMIHDNNKMSKSILHELKEDNNDINTKTKHFNYNINKKKGGGGI
jgi:hypothetical protein